MEGGDHGMSNNIDEKIVGIKFNNGQFQNGVADSLKSLDSLKKGLNLDGAKTGLDDLAKSANGFTLGPLGAAAEGVSGKFVALATIGITALAGITSAALAAGTQLIKSLTIDPIKAGLQEYETNLNSIQTILANTQGAGTTLDQVKKSLQELNTYSDQTIYNFGEMARNIGTFTAAGVKLDVATNAIKGIANLAALSGSNSVQAATVMQQLSQELAAGRVTLLGWNSVVTAGMGGQVFQDALKETARAMGVGVDAIIEKNGSFRESLKEGWLTSEVLTKTLSKFTGDLTDDALKAQGYTADQIISIQALAKTASDAATKVKTATQLVGTLQEAVGSGWSKTFELILGDFDEAPKIFTAINNAIGGMIGAQADARNQLLTDWRDAGGRDSAIQAVVNIFNALMAVIGPIKAALAQIFPPATGAQLAAITDAIEKFTLGLVLSAEAQENLKRTAAGVFAVFDIIFTVVGKVVGMLFNLVGAAGAGGTGILNFTGDIGDFLVSLRDAIKSGDGLSKFFTGLEKVLAVPISLIRGFVGLIIELVSNMGDIDTTGVTSAFDRIGQRLQPLLHIGDTVNAVFAAMGRGIKAAVEFFGPLGVIVGGVVKQFTDAIKTFMEVGDFNTILDVVNVGLLGGLVLLVKHFIDTITEKFKGFGTGGGLLDTIKGSFGQLTDTLSAMQGQLKAKTLILIAGAVALLTVSVVALSMIDSGKLASALTGIGVMFTQLIVAFALLNKITLSGGFIKMPVITASLILLAIAIDLLAIAVAKLSGLNFGDLMKGLLGVAVAMGIMVAATKLISGGGPGMVVAGVAMIAFAIALNVLADAVAKFGSMDIGQMIQGLIAVTVMMGLIVGFTRTVGNPVLLISTATGLVILGGALLIMASAVEKLGGMNPETLVKGLTSMAIALTVVALAVRALPVTLPITAVGLVIVAAALEILANVMEKIGSLSVEQIVKGLVGMAGALLIIAGAMTLMSGALPGAAALIVVAFSLNIIADAFIVLASMSWDDIGRVAVILAGALLIIAGGMYLMTGALPGAAAMIVVAAALAIIAPVLVLLGSMSWDEIGRGLTVLGAALAIIGVAGALITPAVPGLLGLGAAIMLIGLGAALAGIGMLAFAAGFTALSLAAGTGMAVIIGAIAGVAALIPFIAEQIGLGIIAIAAVIGTNGPTILIALTAILLALVDAIVAIIPALVVAATTLVISLVNAIVVLIPFLLDAGLRLIIGLLDGVAKNIGKIITKGTDIVVALLDGIGRAIPRLLQAGANLILDFINGMADTIRNNTSKFDAAGRNLASAIIDGMTKGISNAGATVIRAITGVANAAINAAKKALGIASPSKVFTGIGEFMMMGMSKGIDALAGMVVKSSVSVADEAVSAVTSSLSDISAAVQSNMEMSPTIRPVLDLTAIKKDAAGISGILGKPTLSLDNVNANASSASSGYEENQRVYTDADGKPTGEAGPTINFTQNNNSPKYLSAAEIYRQTKSQLSVAKGALEK
jgi:tape measure domain-containing protein